MRIVAPSRYFNSEVFTNHLVALLASTLRSKAIMSSKRRWKEWPTRMRDELNGTSGVATVGGSILSVLSFVGLSAVSGAAAVVTGGVGVVIAVGAVGLAGWKAIPPKLKDASNLVGKRISIQELISVYPPLLKISIVGPSRAGKSTLVNMIRNEEPPDERTRGIHVYIAALQVSPVRYIAVVDGGGQLYADQFTVATPADILCIVLDHNDTDNDQQVSQERLNEHMAFLRQLRGYLQSQRSEPLAWIHILLNKRDLWESSQEEDKQHLLTFLSDAEKEWRDGNWAKKVSSAQHSNRYAADVGAFLRQIVGFIDSHNE